MGPRPDRQPVTSRAGDVILAAAPVGATVHGKTTAVHVGRRLSVWQTDITRDDGKRIALTTQSQLVV